MDKRPYRSPLREEQAAATRERILAAGLRLFAERGYPGTSVAEIAREAGVSAETIYASVGSKRGIIDALLARIDGQAVAAAAEERMAALGGGAAAGLAALADIAVAFWLEHGTLVRVLRNGVGDPEIGEAWLERQATRRDLIRRFVDTWSADALRPGLDAEAAADVAWTLTSADVFELLVGVRGWPVATYRSWLADALRREILAR